LICCNDENEANSGLLAEEWSIDAQGSVESKEELVDEELFILWTNADEVTFEKMVSMYARNSILKGWWNKVTVIIWGATAKLAADSELVQEHIKQLIHVGVRVSACKACAEQLGASEALEALGVEVIYWGQPLTTLLKENKKILTV